MHTPFELVCNEIVVRFLTGQLTAAFSFGAVSTIAQQLGFAPVDGRHVQILTSSLARSEAAAAVARSELQRVQEELKALKKQCDEVSEDLCETKRRLANAVASSESLYNAARAPFVQPATQGHLMQLTARLRYRLLQTGAFALRRKPGGLALARIDRLGDTFSRPSHCFVPNHLHIA